MANPYDDANIFQRWTFAFVAPLLRVGMSRALQMEDLYPLSAHDRVVRVVTLVSKAWYSQRKEAASLWRAFYGAFTRDFYLTGFFSVLESVCKISQPVVLRQLLGWLSNAGPHDGAWYGWTMAAVLGGLAAVQTILHHVLFYMTMRGGWNMKLSAMGLLHAKVLRLGGTALQQTTRGQIVNLVSNDVQRFMECAVMGHFFWTSPLDVIAVFLLVARDVGYLAAFAGVATTIITVPLQLRFGKLFMRNRRLTATYTDERVRRTAEALAAVASVKAFGWEETMFETNRRVRQKESAAIWATFALKAVNQTISFAAPITASFATFSVYWAQGNDLQPSTLFATLGLLHILRSSFGLQWIRSVEVISEAKVSCRRIEAFLRLPENAALPSVGGSGAEECATTASVAEAGAAEVLAAGKYSSGPQAGGAAPARENGASEMEPAHKKAGGAAVADHRAVTAAAEPAVAVLVDGENDHANGVNGVVAGSSDAGSGGGGSGSGGSREKSEIGGLGGAPAGSAAAAGATALQIGPGSGLTSQSGLGLGDVILRIEDADFSWAAVPAASGSRAGANAGASAAPGAAASKPAIGATAGASDGEADKASAAAAAATTLCGVDFALRAGELLVVVGPVGCGKSSLLHGILGELPLVRGGLAVHDSARIAYAGQSPFVRACSLRENVTFVRPPAAAGNVAGSGGGSGGGSGDDDARLLAALEAVDLLRDAQTFPDSLDTEIGERGVNLSGGQRARLSLARACYSDAELCLLDDPLSAVDPEVSAHLFDKAVRGALRDRAVVLVTHQLQYLPLADKVLVLDASGKALGCAPLEELRRRGLDVTKYVTPASVAEKGGDDDDAADDAEVDDALDDEGAAAAPARRRSRARARSGSNGPGGGNSSGGKKPAAEPTRLVVAEDRVIGSVSASTYGAYARRAGAWRVAGTAALMVAAQLTFMASDLWLTFWSQADNQRPPWRLGVFGGLVGATLLLGLARGTCFFRLFLRAANSVHHDMFWAVLKAPMVFFYENPTGRILNKFSKDQGNADELLPVNAYDASQIILFALGAVGVVCATVPWVLLLMAPLAYLFAKARARYLASCREIKRLEAMSRSPIYAEFSATLDGLTTLRAYKAEAATHRHFLQLLEDNGRAWYCFILVSRWLGFRLDAETSVFLAATALLTAGLKGTVNPGMAGFALLYSLSLSGQFQWAVRQTAETETHMTAVERMLYYAALEPEPDTGAHFTNPPKNSSAAKNPSAAPADGGKDGAGPPPPAAAAAAAAGLSRHSHCRSQPLPPLPTGWPSAGAVCVSNLRVRYRADLPEVLRGISCDAPGGTKVGVVGRTGSGKSSLMLALLRLNQVTEGDISVDGVSLLSLPLATARSCISWIPQEPHMFSGSLRFNLDPLGRSTDAELWSALEEVQLKERFAKDPAGLEAEVSESGGNLSAGQRQLLSLARAILRGSPVVVMDEATANVDIATDHLIQEMLRSSKTLRTRTIITVAHRLRTVITSDVIVVLSAGKVAELGPPAELLGKTPAGALSRMVDKTGRQAAEGLRRMASDAAASSLSLRRAASSSLAAANVDHSVSSAAPRNASAAPRLAGKAAAARFYAGSPAAGGEEKSAAAAAAAAGGFSVAEEGEYPADGEEEKVTATLTGVDGEAEDFGDLLDDEEAAAAPLGCGISAMLATGPSTYGRGF